MGRQKVNFTLDTNVLVRLATQDDAKQIALAQKVLQTASLMAVPTTALCEMVWVLQRGYRYTPEQISHAIRTLLQVSQVVCNTPAVLAGLALLQSGGDFADGVIAFEGQWLGGDTFVSFDKQAVALLQAQGQSARRL